MSSEIKDRAALTDHIATVMQAEYRSTTIDTLLCRPVDAMRMALRVAANAGRLSERQARLIERQLAAIQATYPAAEQAINEICRCALSSRKRGELRRRA